ncbi:MAG TPA: F-box protein, partial [Rhabdochlamydiaceae bacterium]|nr:F-box protein [Rhabdochlamydiaceae bacterium]
MSFAINSYTPFPDHNALRDYSLKCLELPDIFRAACVCKRWNQLFSDQNLWKALFEKEGIPLVISTNGTERKYKEDFKTLYPITISGKTISQYLGKVSEKIP